MRLLRLDPVRWTPGLWPEHVVQVGDAVLGERAFAETSCRHQLQGFEGVELAVRGAGAHANSFAIVDGPAELFTTLRVVGTRTVPYLDRATSRQHGLGGSFDHTKVYSKGGLVRDLNIMDTPPESAYFNRGLLLRGADLLPEDGRGRNEGEANTTVRLLG